MQSREFKEGYLPAKERPAKSNAPTWRVPRGLFQDFSLHSATRYFYVDFSKNRPLAVQRSGLAARGPVSLPV